MPLIVNKFPNTHLMIVGGGYLRPKLEKLAADLKVEKFVTFLGLVSEEDKVLAFNACDIFILPSLAELEGMVVLEAMACGKPIVIGDAKMSASRFFVNENGFLFESKNPIDLAEKISKLVEDKELREKMGQKSLVDSKEYDINKSVEKLEQIYYGVL
jgi:glycosyltransferase involved in cell wall biosynthesis